MYELRFSTGVEKDLKKFTAYNRAKVLDQIETQLLEEATVPARNRKLLVNLIPPWPATPPIWELRIGEYRIFYDESEEEAVVCVRAIKKKPPGKTTEEIL